MCYHENMKPKLSILIPAYNAAKTIAKALDSIPRREDIEVIVYDDGSTDGTTEAVLKYEASKPGLYSTILRNEENHGVAHAVNQLIEHAAGEWCVLLGSDDWLLTEAFNSVVNMLKTETLDLVYFNLQTNDGTIYQLTNETKGFYCGSTKFMRTAFIGDTRLDETKKAGEDYYFFIELQKKHPREAFTNITAKHYNYPREGSLSDRRKRGEFTKDEV